MRVVDIEFQTYYFLYIDALLTDSDGGVWKLTKSGAPSNSVMILVGLVYSGVIMGRSGIGRGGGNCVWVLVMPVCSLCDSE